EQLAALKSVPFDKLDQAGKVDYVLFGNHLTFELKELDHEKAKSDEVASLLSFAPPLVSLMEERLTRADQDPRSSAGILAGIPDQISSLRKELAEQKKAKTAPGPVLAVRAASRVSDLKR